MRKWQLPEKILNRDLETSHSARDVLNNSMSQLTPDSAPTASSKCNHQGMFGKLLQVVFQVSDSSGLRLCKQAQPLKSCPASSASTTVLPSTTKDNPACITKNSQSLVREHRISRYSFLHSTHEHCRYEGLYFRVSSG